MPDYNDLADIAELFVRHVNGEPDVESPVVRLVDADHVTANERWDVARFWTDAELVDLGERTPSVPRLTFIEEVTATLTTLQEDLAAAQAEFESLTSSEMRELPLADETMFQVRSGSRVTNAQLREHPVDVPVYSCFTDARSVKGFVSANIVELHRFHRRRGAAASAIDSRPPPTWPGFSSGLRDSLGSPVPLVSPGNGASRDQLDAGRGSTPSRANGMMTRAL